MLSVHVSRFILLWSGPPRLLGSTFRVDVCFEAQLLVWGPSVIRYWESDQRYVQAHPTPLSTLTGSCMAERGHMAFTRGHHRWVLWPPKTLSAANKGIDKLFIGYSSFVSSRSCMRCVLQWPFPQLVMHRTAELVGLRRLTVTEATSRVAELREFGLHPIRAMETTTIVHEHFRSIQCSHANPRVRSAEGQPKDNVVCLRQSSKVSKCQEPRTSDPFGVLRIGTGMLIVFVESDTGKGEMSGSRGAGHCGYGAKTSHQTSHPLQVCGDVLFLQWGHKGH